MAELKFESPSVCEPQILSIFRGSSDVLGTMMGTGESRNKTAMKFVMCIDKL